MRQYPRTLLTIITAWVLFSGSRLAPAKPDTPAVAQAFGRTRPAVELQPDGLYIGEAEEFQSEQPTQPGWKAQRWGENYYAATLANSFLSRKAFLGAPEQCEEAIASTDPLNLADVVQRHTARFFFRNTSSFPVKLRGGPNKASDRCCQQIFFTGFTDLHTNAGTLNNSDHGELTNYGELTNTGALTNAGTLTNNGILNTFSGTFINNGTINGGGTVLGHINDSGTMSPGTMSPGNYADVVTIDGNWIKTGGSKEVDLGGLFSGGGDKSLTEFDWIDVTGNVELAGLLDVQLIATGSNDVAGLTVMASLAKDMDWQNRPISCVPYRLADGAWQPWCSDESHPSFAEFKYLEAQFYATEYEEQKQLLQKVYEQEGVDVFVASLTVSQNDETKELISYCSWSQTVDSLLPVAKLVAFVEFSGDERNMLGTASWSDVVKSFGHLMEKQEGMFPIRYRVREFPDVELVKRLCKPV